MNYSKIPVELMPSPEDYRDFPVSKLGVAATSVFPDEYCIPYVPEPRDQEYTSMCLAFTLAKLKEYQEWKERGRIKKYSPGFIYAYRKDAGEGMYMRVGMNILKKYGVCEDELYPYIGSYEYLRNGFIVQKKSLIAEAASQRIKSYARAYTVEEVKKSLIDNGPMAMAIRIYENFNESDYDGVVPMPSGEQRGGHAVLLVGWTTIAGDNYWVFSNSWGDDWGDGGIGYLPMDFPRTEYWACIDMGANKLQARRVVMHIGQTGYTVNGEQKEMRLAPFTKYVEKLKGDVTFVPIRETAEAIGAKVTWEPVNPDMIEIEV